MKHVLDLLDYRRRVAELYANIRAQQDAQEAHTIFVSKRNDLFAKHSQSALSEAQKEDFETLEYFSYNFEYRFLVEPDFAVEPEVFAIKLRDDGALNIRRVARLSIPFTQGTADLSLFAIEGYGGGLFLPFGDTTNNDTTYGGGRYLLDTIKHSDLGSEGKKLILDFNFAYNPSCAYNSLWDCPLAPFENKLELSIQVGEKAF